MKRFLSGKFNRLFVCAAVLCFLGISSVSSAIELEDENAQLKETVNMLVKRIERLEAQQEQGEDVQEKNAVAIEKLDTDFISFQETSDSGVGDFLGGLKIGGYGEMHANFNQGSDKDVADIHRLVIYLGYDFADWIQFNSEFEIEHAYVTDGSDGELSVEQAYFDFLLGNPFNVRAGRILTPLGITNKWHEPTLFNSVERTSFDKYIIPTTWSSDGIGIFGNLCESVSYEAYVVGGLDGSEFNAKNGIRDGRIKERPSLNDVAVTGRFDFRPFNDKKLPYNQDVRLGVSGYFGGLDNGNKGSNPDIDGDISIVSADFEYSIGKFDFEGAIAHTDIDGAEQIGNGTAEEIFGWYLEAAYHIWPEEWKHGKFERTDAVVFVRYDDYDTQYKMPSSVAKDPAGDRDEWTIGTAVKLTPDVVVKADYQFVNDKSGSNPSNRLNFGIGFTY